MQPEGGAGSTRPVALEACKSRSDLAVRFLYSPLTTTQLPTVLVLRVVPQGDPRYGTSNYENLLGQVVFVSQREADQLLEKLGGFDLVWLESPKSVDLTWRPFGEAPVAYLPGSFTRNQGGPEVVVTCGKGTAAVTISPMRMCRDLEQLDRVFGARRALWEFQWFRRGEMGCLVPGFNPGEFPQD